MSRWGSAGDHSKDGSVSNSILLWQQMVESSWDTYFVFHESGEAIQVSLSAKQWLGKEPRLFVDLLNRVHTDYRAKLRNAWVRMLRESESLDIELRLADCDGKQVWMESCWLRLEMGDSKPLLCIMMRDISARKIREMALEQMAYYDPLTGLANRRYFRDYLDRSISYAKRNSIQLAVLCLDVDLFKQINDTFGHDIGDEFLRDFASQLRHVLRETDLPARIGGDEFIVVLPDVESAEGACLVAQRILAALRKEWRVGKHKFPSSVSIGVAVYPDHGEDSTALLRSADQAMYEVKRNGGNEYKLFEKVNPA
jgi:diguanylate cyclase (GGDEF)-like protein/PAS domain S-box-containing protein